MCIRDSAWTIRKGTKAPQAAGKIHSDFERGFIRASVIGYGDLEATNFDSVSYTHLWVVNFFYKGIKSGMHTRLHVLYE